MVGEVWVCVCIAAYRDRALLVNDMRKLRKHSICNKVKNQSTRLHNYTYNTIIHNDQ